MAFLLRRSAGCAVAFVLSFLGGLDAASAQEESGAFSGGGGTFVGIQFGEVTNVTWGFEAFGTTQLVPVARGCESSERSRAGALFQLRFVGKGDPHLTLAALAVKEFERERQASLSGELGYTFRLRERASAVHFGVLGEIGFALGSGLGLRHELLLNETWTTVGVRFFPTSGPPTFCQV